MTKMSKKDNLLSSLQKLRNETLKTRRRASSLMAEEEQVSMLWASLLVLRTDLDNFKSKLDDYIGLLNKEK